MKKTGLLLLVLVLAMGALGVGYAHWSGELDIDGTVYTGSFGAELTQDNGIFGYAIDDELIGAESCTWQPPPFYFWADQGKTQDNGHAICVLTDEKKLGYDYSGSYNDTMVITVTDAYPCYNVWVPVDVHCTGTVPIKVWYVITNTNPTDVITIEMIEDPSLTSPDVSLVPADSEADAIKLHQCETARALIHIHPLQPVEEDPGPPVVPGVTGASPGVTYTFAITINYEQWQ
jgi:hypothetical protein